jgi:hypothetical protein
VIGLTAGTMATALCAGGTGRFVGFYMFILQISLKTLKMKSWIIKLVKYS